MPDQGVTLNARIQYKKDTDANWTSNNPVLLENELIIVEMENGDCRFKIGDGTHPYVELPFISLGFSGVLGIEQGGTGATDASSALKELRGICRDGDTITGDITYTKGVTVSEDRDTDSPLQGRLYASDNSSSSGAVRIYASVKNSDQGYSAIEITPGSSGIEYVYNNGVGISSGPIYNFMSTIPVSNGGTGGTTKQTAREGLGFTQVGNSTTPVYFNSNAFPTACIPYSSASVASAAKLTTSRTIRTNLSSTSTASFNGTANITPGITGTLSISHGGTGATTASSARTNLGAASSSHTHVTGNYKTSTTLYSGSASAGSTVTASGAGNYTTVFVQVSCGQFSALRIIRPWASYWECVPLANNTHVTFLATSSGTNWTFKVDTTTSSGGHLTAVYGVTYDVNAS